ncbi:signal peptidase I [Microbacterium amylolyticum]|uniref:Signal peptidase I n=1 Tax=Microbacterium amylolyticum TaxID=936337 RepID=A0ABS4ZEQ6_9MICO|nr:signal peptidase I [Microbacterium amylolyticum]MBP2435771.1 signal peptidase I [Microbacterium amylolyticum]
MTIDQGEAEAERRPATRGVLAFARDVVVIVAIAIVISLLIKTFLVRSFYIPSASMEDTLMTDDRILVDQLTVRWNDYERGQIVVFEDPGGWLGGVTSDDRGPIRSAIDGALTAIGLSAADSEEHLVKRIIGMPGDHVVCCDADGHLEINGESVDEGDYLRLLPEGAAASASSFDVTVPDDAIWVLGDNRNRSQDSRFHTDLPGGGFVPLDNVVGRVFLLTWPLGRFGVIADETDTFSHVPAPPAS